MSVFMIAQNYHLVVIVLYSKEVKLNCNETKE